MHKKVSEWEPLCLNEGECPKMDRTEKLKALRRFGIAEDRLSKMYNGEIDEAYRLYQAALLAAPKPEKRKRKSYKVKSETKITWESSTKRWTNYQEYLRTPHWQELRAKVLKRANFVCEECKRDVPLHVHHENYKRVGYERLEDLKALCYDCHKAKHPGNAHFKT